MTLENTALKRIETAANLVSRQPWSKNSRKRLRAAIQQWEQIDSIQETLLHTGSYIEPRYHRDTLSDRALARIGRLWSVFTRPRRVRHTRGWRGLRALSDKS